jgi:hypothetical protein
MHRRKAQLGSHGQNLLCQFGQRPSVIFRPDGDTNAFLLKPDAPDDALGPFHPLFCPPISLKISAGAFRAGDNMGCIGVLF